MEPWLETERLSLRRFVPADFEWLCELYDDPDVTRYLGGRQAPHRVQEMLRTRFLDYYDSHPGLGIWLTTERSTQNRVGFHLLNNIQGETIIQVGFALAKPAWGQGYGTEMARAVLQHGFNTLRLPHIVGMASLANVASQRVLEKIGLRRNGERAFPHAAYAAEGPMAWFERSRVEWLADQEPSPRITST